MAISISQIHENGEITVTQMFVMLRLEQSVATQHLRILRSTGFVTIKRQGKLKYYAVDYKHLESLQQIIKEIVN